MNDRLQPLRHRLTSGLGLLLLLVLAGCSGAPQFHGTVLAPPRPAMDFTLTDQSGEDFELSSLRGKAVVLTFIYTHCPDVCPLTTAKIAQAYRLLGDAAQGVVIVEATVDPARDTVDRMNGYARQYGLEEAGYFLTGSEEVLKPLWDYYWVGELFQQPAEGQTFADQVQEGSAVGNGSVESLVALAGSYTVGHASPVFLIDTAGQIRVVYDASFTPAQLASDARALSS